MPLRTINRALLTLGLGACLGGPALADAQTDRLRALEQKLESSLQLIDKLSARLAELERTRAVPAAAGAAAVAATPAITQTVTALQDSVNQLTESVNRRPADQGLPVHGFADVGAGWSSRKDPVKLRGFNGGTLDLYLTPQFSDRAKGLVELAVEYGDDGHVAVDLERLQLGYTLNDALTLWLGRFHTPFGLWNTAYHHGANLQNSIHRPRFIDFEDKGGIIAAHSVGVWGHGAMALGPGRLGYDLFVSNGPRIAERVLDFNAFTDNSSNKMLGFNLSYQPSAAAGLTLGLHGFRSTVTALDNTGVALGSTRVNMTGAYLGYDENDWEVIGEYYRFANKELGSPERRTSQAGFLQVGRTLGLWTPFVRHEKASLDRADLYFARQESGRSYTRQAVGLRYTLDPKSSFKFELSTTREGAADLIDDTGAADPFAARTYRRASLQYSAAF